MSTGTNLGARSARIVTVRELSRDTAGVLREINDQKEPAFVTRHGRFVAMITPLEDQQVEARALQHVAAELLPRLEQLDNERFETSVSDEELS
ncbi:type II toxin-antitoxin system prevent-host-death family antitoxin [Streptomyces asiaticus]|uniref:type II toxin-antitoxin system prevent-host-death family antitoxin n=1 Tax=Streptomyces asiaticus TaxID=114695 RepID=UPI003F676132